MSNERAPPEICRKLGCFSKVGWVGWHDRLCAIHWAQMKILGVFGLG